MSSAVIPQWKVALQQKLDKKKEEERRKKLEEEQRRLEALPPWKRMRVPQNVIIISGGTTTVSKLSADSDATEDVAKQEETSESKSKTKSVKSAGSPKSGFSGGSAAISLRSRSGTSEIRTNVTNASQSHVMSSPSRSESKLTNHVGEDVPDGGTAAPIAVGHGREGVDEEHVSSVFDNPFLKHDGGMRRRKTSVSSKPETTSPEGRQNVSKVTENKTTDSIKVVKKQPDNNIRQRSRSASPRRAARDRNIDVKFDEQEDLPETRPRKNSVSDLRSRFGRAASIEDLKIVSRKHSESDDGSPGPKSPTVTLDRSKLFDEQPHKVHINLKPDSAKGSSPPSPSKESTAKSVTSDRMPSTQLQSQKSSVVKDSTTSKQSETKPSVSVTQAKIGSAPSNGVVTKQHAPKAPITSNSGSISRDNVKPATTATLSSSGKNDARPVSESKTSVNSSAPSSANQKEVKTVDNDLAKSNKPVQSSDTSNMTNQETLPDQPKTAILGEGQSSLQRKRGTAKMSASALISLSGDNNSNDVQLSEHNARVRAARQEARASTSKNLLRSARDTESKDTESIPKGAVSASTFGSKVNTPVNSATPTAASKDDTPNADAIPYPTNFRQPKKESTYVDTIPYPENFRQPKSSSQDSPEQKTPSVTLKSNNKKNELKDDIPRTNIDEVILSPIQEGEVSSETKLVNGCVEGKAPPKKIKKTLDVEFIGFNTPAGRPSAMKKSSQKLRNSESDNKKMSISFNESNLSETYEYQSESSLLNEYLREERGLNGNPRVGNLPRQEAKDEDDEDESDATSSSQGSMDNVLAHEGLQNYTPKDLQNFSPMSFRQQQQKQREAPKPKEDEPPPTEEQDPDDVAITYDDAGDYFSSAGSDSAALLF